VEQEQDEAREAWEALTRLLQRAMPQINALEDRIGAQSCVVRTYPSPKDEDREELVVSPLDGHEIAYLLGRPNHPQQVRDQAEAYLADGHVIALVDLGHTYGVFPLDPQRPRLRLVTP